MLCSCVMPTYSARGSRRDLIPLAIHSYLHQDWPEKELIVVASGEDVSDLFVGVPNVTYIPRDEHESLGRKRNLGCEFASGEFIAHWDDDDWSGPGRLTDQINRMLESGKSVSGYNRLNFWDVNIHRACQYIGDKNYACDSSLVYRKDYWEKNKFKEDLGTREDSSFAHKAARNNQLVIADSREHLVSITHGKNTSHEGPRPFPIIAKENIPARFFQDIECAFS
jgi:glycosyltransferase involved in cell wall biosynthesis